MGDILNNIHATTCPSYIPWLRTSCNCGASRLQQAKQDLEVLLALPSLGAWGMEALNDTLSVLLPELRHSTIED